MKFSVEWLKTYLRCDCNINVILDALNDLGLEVESVTDPAENFSNFIVGKITEVEKHPNADKLKVCSVYLGNEKKQIVCGAPNVKLGMGVVVALPGTFIPGLGKKISIGKIRNVESFGMMCSEFELNLSDEHDGIICLDQPNVGKTFAEWLKINEPNKVDPVIEIAITPNRPDALGVRGIARDLAAKGIGQFLERKSNKIYSDYKSPINVILKKDVSERDCPYFVGRYIKGIRNDDSPTWLVNRLNSINLRPISSLVDLTNFLTFDSARPLHAFDADKLKGNLVVRKAFSGEEIEALDGKNYELDDSMTIIADDQGVQAIGGLIGGMASGCTEDTRNVFIESAYFDPISTAKTGRKLGLITDARYRFERGIDPSFTISGIELYTELATNICGGKPSELVCSGNNPYKAETIDFQESKVEKVTGIKVPKKRQLDILRKLGFTLNEKVQPISVQAPSWRPDIGGEIDLVEEIIRVTSLDKLIASPLPIRNFGVRAAKQNSQRRSVSKIRRYLASQGLRECISYSFIDEPSAKLFGEGKEEVTLANSISSEMTHLRPSLFPGLLLSAKRNNARGVKNFSSFEIGEIFTGSAPGQEQLDVGGIFVGYAQERNAFENRRPFDIFDAKSCVEGVLRHLGIKLDSLQLDRRVPNFFHPNKSALVRLGKFKVLGSFGELHPNIALRMGLGDIPIIFSIFPEQIPDTRDKLKKSSLEYSDYPSVVRDFAFVMRENVEVQEIMTAIKKLDKDLIKEVKLFDVFEGSKAYQQVGPGKKSLAFEVLIQPRNRTLKDKEIELLCEKIIAEVNGISGGSLR